MYCSLCSGAEHLSQVLHGAVPDGFWDSGAHMASTTCFLLNVI
jgi:gamma-tubulin complex component 5